MAAVVVAPTIFPAHLIPTIQQPQLAFTTIGDRFKNKRDQDQLKNSWKIGIATTSQTDGDGEQQLVTAGTQPTLTAMLIHIPLFKDDVSSKGSESPSAFSSRLENEAQVVCFQLVPWPGEERRFHMRVTKIFSPTVVCTFPAKSGHPSINFSVGQTFTTPASDQPNDDFINALQVYEEGEINTILVVIFGDNFDELRHAPPPLVPPAGNGILANNPPLPPGNNNALPPAQGQLLIPPQVQTAFPMPSPDVAGAIFMGVAFPPTAVAAIIAFLRAKTAFTHDEVIALLDGLNLDRDLRREAATICQQQRQAHTTTGGTVGQQQTTDISSLASSFASSITGISNEGGKVIDKSLELAFKSFCSSSDGPTLTHKYNPTGVSQQSKDGYQQEFSAAASAQCRRQTLFNEELKHIATGASNLADLIKLVNRLPISFPISTFHTKPEDIMIHALATLYGAMLSPDLATIIRWAWEEMKMANVGHHLYTFNVSLDKLLDYFLGMLSDAMRSRRADTAGPKMEMLIQSALFSQYSGSSSTEKTLSSEFSTYLMAYKTQPTAAPKVPTEFVNSKATKRKQRAEAAAAAAAATAAAATAAAATAAARTPGGAARPPPRTGFPYHLLPIKGNACPCIWWAATNRTCRQGKPMCKAPHEFAAGTSGPDQAAFILAVDSNMK